MSTHPYLQYSLSVPAFSQQRVHVLNMRCGGEKKGQLSWHTQHHTCSQGFGKHRGEVSHLYPQFRLYKLLEKSITLLYVLFVDVSQAANDHFTPECFESSLGSVSHARGSQAPGQVSLAFNLSRAEKQ